MKYKAVLKVVGVLSVIGLIMVLTEFVIGGITGAAIGGMGAALCIGTIFGTINEVRIGILIGILFSLPLGMLAGEYAEGINSVFGGLMGMLFLGLPLGLASSSTGAKGGMAGGLVGGALAGLPIGFFVGGKMGMYVGFLVGSIIGFFVGVSVGSWNEAKKKERDNELDTMMKYKVAWKFFGGVFCLPGLFIMLIGFIIRGLVGALIAVTGIGICIGAVAGVLMDDGRIPGAFVGAFVGTTVGPFISWYNVKDITTPALAVFPGMIVGGIVGWFFGRIAEGVKKDIIEEFDDKIEDILLKLESIKMEYSSIIEKVENRLDEYKKLGGNRKEYQRNLAEIKNTSIDRKSVV